MEATVAAPALPAKSSALSAQVSPKKNTACQPPPRNVTGAQDSLGRVTATNASRNIVSAAQNSLDRAIAATAPKDIVTAAKESLERAVAASPQTSPRNFVAQNSQENAIASAATVTKSPASTLPAQSLSLQPQNINTAAQISNNNTFAQNAPKTGLANYIPQQMVNHQALHQTIVTPQGTWQNVAPPMLQQHTLPAVQDFLQKAFETVQRSQNTGIASGKNTLQNVAIPPPPQIALAMVRHPLPIIPPTFVATPLSPQTSLPAPFKSLQNPATPQPYLNAKSPQAAPLPDLALKKPSKTKQTLTKSTESSTSLEQTPNTNEISKASTSRTGTIAKSQSYPGYTVYNTTRHSNPKQTLSPKRSVLVAKRLSVVEKPEPETDKTVQNPTSETLTEPIPKVQSSNALEKKNAPEKRNIGQSPKGSPAKQNSSRVAQTFKEFKERGAKGAQTSSQPGKGRAQNAQSSAAGSNRGARRHKPEHNGLEEVDPTRKVLVSGFPAYTQSPDLIRVLSRFGSCQVDSCRNRLAVVTFESEVEAKNAIRFTEDIIIYGEYIEIYPYTNSRHVDELYRAYKKVISTQKGQDIIMPNKIDLAGDFFQQLENIQVAIRLTREQVQAVTNLYVDLELVLQQEWPGCVAIPFGSIPTGLGIKSSDADCYVELPAALRPRGAAGGGTASFVSRARRLLQFFPGVFSHLVAIPRANTPIVKFRHVPSGFHCDVSAKTPLGAQNSKLIKLLLEHDARLTPVAVLVKYWAKVHELSGTGRLTNYALTMMVVFYFQQPAVGLAPPVERLQRDPASRYLVDHWNAGFSSRKLPGKPNPVTLPDLLGGFFEFYAGFDFDKLIVCPYLGAPVPKTAFEPPNEPPAEFARYVRNVRDNLAGPIRHGTSFCVQDPFEQSHNVASSVSARLAADIRAYMRFAADAYVADRANGFRNFIRTILLTRPKLRQDRVTPTTTVILVPRQRGHIADPDWRGALREIVVGVIFERMLRLPLLKREEEKDPGLRPGKYDRETYSGAVSKPVWRRKKWQGGRGVPLPELVERQALLSDAILAAPLAAGALDFELELWFREEPRYCSIAFKMIDGDMDSYRNFVTFLHTVMLEWFKELLKPHLEPLKENSAAAVAAKGTHAGEATARSPAGAPAGSSPAGAPARSSPGDDTAEDSACDEKVEGSADDEAACLIKFERELPRPPSPPRLVPDPAQLARELRAVALDSDTESSDGSKKELR